LIRTSSCEYRAMLVLLFQLATFALVFEIHFSDRTAILLRRSPSPAVIADVRHKALDSTAVVLDAVLALPEGHLVGRPAGEGIRRSSARRPGRDTRSSTNRRCSGDRSSPTCRSHLAADRSGSCVGQGVTIGVI